MFSRSGFFVGLAVILLAAAAWLYPSKSERTEAANGISQNETQENTGAAKSEYSDCEELTPTSTEGPYYKAGSPQRKDIASKDSDKITVEGYVLDRDCAPVADAWLDFWQADANGSYDNAGFDFRGHQYMDNSGRYTLITVKPSQYPGRTPHIHVKVRATEESPVLTTQLYFPDQDKNDSDSIFNERLLVNYPEQGRDNVARFNFVVNKS